APHTTITAGPSGLTTSTTARFEFTSTEPGRFECLLDTAPFAPCGSPFPTPVLGIGPHHFEVRAIDAGGTRDPPPAVRAWTVTTLVPPRISITAAGVRPIKASQLTTVRGTAISPLGVTMVRVSLRRSGEQRTPGEPPVCRFVSLQTGRVIRNPCVVPPFRR